MRSLAVAALVLALAAAPEPVAGQATVPPTWLGITFETPAAKLRETLGDPVRLTRLPNERTAPELASAPPERKARYVLSFKTPLFLIVSERHGAVVGIEVFSNQPLAGEVTEVAPDPSGIVLGATEAAVLKAHPDAQREATPEGARLFAQAGPRYLIAYEVKGGRVSTIDWFARASTDAAKDGPPLTEPTGDDPANAILVLAVLFGAADGFFQPAFGGIPHVRAIKRRVPGARRAVVDEDRPASGITAIFHRQHPAVWGMNCALHAVSY